MPKKPPQGLLKRSSKLLSMATKVASKEIGRRVSESVGKKVEDFAPEAVRTRIEQAKAITTALSQLKGAAMKAGQMLSIDASEFLPPEAREVLSQLQNEAEPVDYQVIYDVMVKELGFEKFKSLDHFDKEPLASASIGQVHRAQVNGEDVIFKVQYPGVDKSIESDLRLLRQVAQSFVRISGRRVDLAETFDELATVLKWETDYKRESHYLEKFHQQLSAHNHFVVPQYHSDFSTGKVLCMSYESGITLNEWLKQNPPLELRQKLGHLVLDLFCTEFLDWGMVQTDPNFANFLVRPSTEEVVLLDFGATLEYDDDFRQGYGQVLLDLSSGDSERVFSSVVEFGLLDEKEPQETRLAFQKMLEISLEPLQPESQPFEFSDLDYERRARDSVIEFSRCLKYSAPPRKILFLHRKLGGIFNLLKQMDVKLDLLNYWDRMIGHHQSN